MKQTNNHEEVCQAIAEVKRRHFFCCAVVWSLKLLTVWNFILGFVFLLVRQLGFKLVDFAGFSAIGLPVCILSAMLFSFRRALPEEKVLALLDNYNHCGGILLAEQETGDKGWSNKISGKLQIPEFSVNYGGQVPNILISIVFLALCISVPVYSITGPNDRRINLSEIKENILEQIDTLVETETVEPEKAEELVRALENIVSGSDNTDPSRTFEALDQLQEKLKKEASREAQKLQSDLEKLGQLNSLAEELKKQSESSPEAAKALNEMLKKMAESKEGKELMGKSKELGRALENALDGSASEQSLQDAARQLQEYIEQEVEKKRQAAQKIVKARMIDKKTFDKLMKEGKIKPATLQDIKDNPDAELLVAPGECESGQSGSGKDGSGISGAEAGGDGMSVGNGGVSAGGGTAPLKFNRLTSEHRVKFIDEALPSPSEGSLEDSVAIGQGVTAPEILPADSSGSGKAVDWKQQNNNAVESELILPRHRSAVKKFFERNNP